MKTIIGLFDDYGEAETAVSQLRERGSGPEDISVIVTEAARLWGKEMPDVEQKDRRHEAMAGAALTGVEAGAATGAGVGGLVGLLAGVGAIAVPGIGPVIAAGPLAAALAGVGIGATAGGLVGGLVGALTKVGVPERDAEFYAEAVRRGGTMVIVRAPDEAANAVADTLGGHGAVDVDQRRAYYESSGFTGFKPDAAPLTAEEIADERTRRSAHVR